MYISRKAFKLRTNKNRVQNENPSSCEQGHTQNLTVTEEVLGLPPIKTKTLKQINSDLEITRYPTISYFLGIMLMIIFGLLFYSVRGGVNSIPGFNNGLWWQYAISAIPMLISVLIFILCQIEKIQIRHSTIQFTKTILLGMKLHSYIGKDIAELINISIIKKGIEKITFTNSSYFLVFNFKPFHQIQMFEANSEKTVVDYLEKLKPFVPNNRFSTKKISIKNIIET